MVDYTARRSCGCWKGRRPLTLERQGWAPRVGPMGGASSIQVSRGMAAGQRAGASPRGSLTRPSREPSCMRRRGTGPGSTNATILMV